mmetsp:Transcript_15087/g.34246  ORF Transcript_15087/g.34246 Transcript_15087/m.34246 type:complete len:498 (+) Transcript_15087:1-1494(+)
MVRRIEPELPPLGRPVPVQRSAKKGAEVHFKMRASPSAMFCWSPKSRRDEIIPLRREDRDNRFAQASLTRVQTSEDLTNDYEQALQRKRQQGEKALVLQKQPSKKASAPNDTMQQQWFSVFIIASFMRQASEDLRVGKMPTQERMQYVEAQAAQQESKVTMRRSSQLVIQAMLLGAIMQDDQAKNRFALFSDMVKCRIRLKEARSQANVIHNCLSSWRVAGRVINLFKGVHNRVLQIQHWWRETSRRLRDIRNRILRRWERLERSALAGELTKAKRALPPQSGKGSGPPPVKLSMEDKIQMEMMDEGVRVRFVENELRARRYQLLPQIELWQEEVNRWREKRADWKATKEAYKALGKEAPALKVFHWPPVRPSYLPKGHPSTEARGCPCHEKCLGRQGDEEILSMWRAVRADPMCTSITAMPEKGSYSAVFRSNQRRRPVAKPSRGRRTAQESQLESSRPFGEASEKDLAVWGVNPTTMPGLSAGNEGQPANVAVPC